MGNDSNAKPAAKVIMYSTAACPYCMRAKRLLSDKNIAYTDIRVDLEPQRRAEMIEKSGRRTVPQIWINAQHIGGADELMHLERTGTLDVLLAQT